MTITKSMIEERISVLDSDIKSVNEKLQSLEQQKNESLPQFCVQCNVNND